MPDNNDSAAPNGYICGMKYTTKRTNRWKIILAVFNLGITGFLISKLGESAGLIPALMVTISVSGMWLLYGLFNRAYDFKWRRAIKKSAIEELKIKGKLPDGVTVEGMMRFIEIP